MKTEKEAPPKWDEKVWKEKVVEQSQANHIWLNAFSCINPTKEFCEELGRNIIEKLKHKENLIPDDGITSDNKTMRELSMLTPMLYLSINKS